MRFSLVLALLTIQLHGIAQSLDYFQQEVNYRISVQLDDQKHELSGLAEIEYKNNSPNRLDYIWFHVWPNAYKNNQTALAKQLVENGDTYFHYLSDDKRGYMDGIAFEVDGIAAQWEYHPEHIDIIKLTLPNPVGQNKTVSIKVPFHVKIPDGRISRLGHINQSYFITQWYPKPAVYDHKGWHAMPYLTQGEFYSEFGSFDVSITIPKNYVVGATGDLKNCPEEEKWLNDKATETAAMTSFDGQNNFPESDTVLKTIRFTQKNVHDFAWFADKRWNVLKGEVELPESKRKVTTWAYFTNKNAKYWKKAPEYLRDATWFYSKHCGEYPYNHVTAVDGTISAGGGMEYPNITVIGNANSDFTLETVIMHEVGHNWFYGILGSNERQHGWMDEGLNSFFESRYNEWKNPGKGLQALLPGNLKGVGKMLNADAQRDNFYYELAYLLTARKGEDQPIETPSQNFTSMNYGGVMYCKSADVFNYLLAYLGEEKTDAIFKAYFNEWKFRHPYPEDLRKIAENVSGEKLDWLFTDLINTNRKLDYKIMDVDIEKERVTFEVKNVGDVASPLFVSGVKGGKVVKTDIHGGFEGTKEFYLEGTDYDQIVLDVNRRSPDINRFNNQSRTHGLFKTWEKPQVRLIGSLENPEKTQIFFSPIVGWNRYNQFMLGGAVYNALIPARPFEYLIAPMYAFGTKDLAGHADVAYNWYPRLSFFQKISLSVNASRYAYSSAFGGLNFNIISPTLHWVIKKSDKRSGLEQQFTFRTLFITKAVSLSNETLGNFSINNKLIYINDYVHRILNNRTLNPYSIVFNVQQGEGWAKASIESKYTITFKGKNKGFESRLFYGLGFVYRPNVQGDYRFRLSGQTGAQDYLYNETFLGRMDVPNQSFLGNQFTESDGNFKVYSPIGQSDRWILAANFKTSLHRKIPFKLYADIGTYFNARNAFPTSRAFVYNYGVSLPLLNNVIEVYFPIGYSSDIRNYMDINGIKWYERFRFTLNLRSLSPVKMIRELSF